MPILREHIELPARQKRDGTLTRPVFAWVLAAALAACVIFSVGLAQTGSGVFALMGEGSLSGEDLISRIAGLAWGSLEAGVVEEVLFRGIILGVVLIAVRRLNERCAIGAAIAVSTFAFAAAHVITSLPDFASPLDAPTSIWMSAGFALLLKSIQAGLFGFVMAVLTIVNRSLGMPVLIHTAFDLIYFAPGYLATGAFPATYATGDVWSLAALTASSLLLMPPVFASARALGYVEGNCC